MASVKKRADGKWRARYRDHSGKEHARHFDRKVDATRWLDGVTASVVRGDYVDPKLQRVTVGEWCDQWLKGYATRRPSTVRQAKVHIELIKVEFATTPLQAVKPSDVKAWTAKLQAEDRAPSYVYATYRRLAQIMGDAAHDGLIARSPCSRRTAPPQGQQRPYVATTAQVWSLYDAFPEHLRPAILLGAFAGLRVSEAAGLRVEHVDFENGIVTPAVQHGDVQLKSEKSRQPIPVPVELAQMLPTWGTHVVPGEIGRGVSPWAIERGVRSRRVGAGLPDAFRFHDLRHFFASLLIGAGLDVKVVQTRLRHGTAATTLDTYGHLWPDADESARAAVADVLAARADSVRTDEGA